MLFPLASCEHHCCWVGLSETVGNLMTCKNLADDTRKIIHCTKNHSDCDPSSQNLHMDPINTDPPQVIKSLYSPSFSLPHGEDFTTVVSYDDIGHVNDDASEMNDNDSHHMSIICANDL
jgi:hypothetical protein